jgi:radical SAM enzyme (TIGR01210 family)
MGPEPGPPPAGAGPYPGQPRERNRWIEALRPARVAVDPWRPQGFFVETERTERGDLARNAAVLITNRECPWRCAMCDLWRHTLRETVPAGAIAAQLDFALARLPAARRIKLYNSGSFFDPRAIPRRDRPAIAARLAAFERVVVECHPALVGEDVVRFRDTLGAGRLEVAMGLETACPEALERLNKRMTLDQFRTAAAFLRGEGVALRVFVLVRPPFIPATAAADWVQRSLAFAFECGATAVVLIPTRGGNGALEALAAQGQFTPPDLGALEAALDQGLTLRGGRVFADLWDIERLGGCDACRLARRDRLRATNDTQQVQPAVQCGCGGSCPGRPGFCLDTVPPRGTLRVRSEPWD